VPAPPDPVHVVTAAQMRAMDAETIDALGVPGLVLMEQAGTLAAVALARRYGPPMGKRIVVLCGKGNNGGDGFVVARHLLIAGAEVAVFLAGLPGEVAGDARAELETFAGIGGTVHPASEVTSRRLKAALDQADVVVDALFGTGLSAPLRPPARDWVRAANRAAKPIVAIDIPSGIDGDTGRIMGDAIRADLTVTFACPKRGHFLVPGMDHRGDLVVADIGIPPAVRRRLGGAVTLLTAADAAALVPQRRAAAHKGSFGHVLVIGASVGMTGAATLAAKGALGAGAGLATVAAPEGLNDVLEQKLTEAMTLPMPETADRSLAEAALKPLLEAAAARSVAVLGPGIARAPETARLVRAFTRDFGGPLVLDADGLNAWAGKMDAFPRRAAPTVLTPHPGEMARLVGRSTAEVQGDRMEAAWELARRIEAVVVLKGAHTVIADPFGGVRVNPTGNPSLATGGTGDVLAGMIGAYLAQGLSAPDAGALAAYVHGLAADLWVRAHGTHGTGGLGAEALAGLIPDAAAAAARGVPAGPVTFAGPLS
jgi:hydroxyethylthiazole kinase-like uncharacterized protein yjeF